MSNKPDIPTTPDEIEWDMAIPLDTAAKFMKLSIKTLQSAATRATHHPLKTIKITNRAYTSYRWIWEWCNAQPAGPGRPRPSFPIAEASPPPTDTPNRITLILELPTEYEGSNDAPNGNGNEGSSP